MKKKVLISMILMSVLIILGTVKSNAGSLYLNDLDFNAQIKNDGSMDVVENWNIKVQNTNTLYKSFKTDKNKFSGITDVTVKEITDEQETDFIKSDNWAYHVQKGYYYGTKNEDGDFEIGWGVGLDTSTAYKKYQISYTVKDAITKYNDFAELYWQFVGEDFEINAKKITGTIYLPSDVSNKDEIKVWGHTKGLNGTIYATDTNKIEFQIKNFKNGTYVEARTLFPTSLINTSGRTKNVNILDKAIKEETKWADKANKERWLAENSPWIILTALVLIGGTITLIIIYFEIKKTKKYKNRLKELKNEEKIMPSTKYEYFREIPDENTTPGEVIKTLNPIMSSFTTSVFGKIFSATMLDLTLKKYLEIKLEKNEKNKEVTNIYVLKQVGDGLKDNEERIMTFIKNAAGEKKVITLKNLQKYIKEHPSKVESLLSSTFKASEQQLYNEKILNDKAHKEYKDLEEEITKEEVLIIFLLFLIIFIIPIIPAIIAIINVILCKKIEKMLNILTQKGIDRQTEWKGLKTFMQEFSMLDKREVPELVLWEKYLVYATVMGVADKVIKQLKIVYPDFDKMSDGLTTYTYMNLMLHTDFSNSFSNAISSSIQSARATYSSTYSSGSGGGGGFSGGGGFGRRPEAAVAGR